MGELLHGLMQIAAGFQAAHRGGVGAFQAGALLGANLVGVLLDQASKGGAVAIILPVDVADFAGQRLAGCIETRLSGLIECGRQNGKAPTLGVNPD